MCAFTKNSPTQVFPYVQELASQKQGGDKVQDQALSRSDASLSLGGRARMHMTALLR